MTAGIAGFGIDYFTMPRRVLTFALDGKAALPPAPPPLKLVPPSDPGYQPDLPFANRGRMLFDVTCANCHGMDAVAAGSAPDLRVSAVPTRGSAFEAVVRKGALIKFGMPQYADLSQADLDAIRQYLRSRAQALPKGGH